MTVTHNGKQYTAKKLNDNEWQLTSVPEIKTTDGEVSDESDIHSIMLEKSAKAESKAPQASHKGR